MITSFLIDISHDSLSLNDEQILDEEDEGMQEILFGLKILFEDLTYNKGKADEVIQLIQEKKDIQEALLKSEKKRNEELKKNELELSSNNQLLSEKNAELEHFAYIISHDLKAPLMGIDSLATFIEEDLRDSNKENVFSYLKTLKERVYRMESLIEGILEFSKIGMMESRKEETNLNTLVTEIFESQNTSKDFEFKILSPLPSIYGIKSQFVQLFANLISNGIKFNDKAQGSIHIDYNDLGKEHEFSVKDNGPGVPKAYHKKVFIIFQTLNARDTYESTGIGLSIVKKIMVNLNGSISLESIKNKGAKFTLKIPKN